MVLYPIISLELVCIDGVLHNDQEEAVSYLREYFALGLMHRFLP